VFVAQLVSLSEIYRTEFTKQKKGLCVFCLNVLVESSCHEPLVQDHLSPHDTKIITLIPITLIWIFSLLPSLSPTATHINLGLDSLSAPKISFAPLNGLQLYSRFEFGIDPSYRLRSRRSIMLSWLLSISTEQSLNEQE